MTHYAKLSRDTAVCDFCHAPDPEFTYVVGKGAKFRTEATLTDGRRLQANDADGLWGACKRCDEILFHAKTGIRSDERTAITLARRAILNNPQAKIAPPYVQTLMLSSLVQMYSLLLPTFVERRVATDVDRAHGNSLTIEAPEGMEDILRHYQDNFE